MEVKLSPDLSKKSPYLVITIAYLWAIGYSCFRSCSTISCIFVKPLAAFIDYIQTPLWSSAMRTPGEFRILQRLYSMVSLALLICHCVQSGDMYSLLLAKIKKVAILLISVFVLRVTVSQNSVCRVGSQFYLVCNLEFRCRLPTGLHWYNCFNRQ